MQDDGVFVGGVLGGFARFGFWGLLVWGSQFEVIPVVGLGTSIELGASAGEKTEYSFRRHNLRVEYA